ncbi:MAG TPA: hypothetical protein VFM18_23635 [Methanosarcina sp.]|nr:hypothetical protein [Methanosarcina sp.]
MTASLRSDASGNQAAIQINGADKLLLTSDGAMSTPVVTGAHKNLKLLSTGTSGIVNVTADELVLSTGAGLYKLVQNVIVAPNTLVSGFNGLDTGAAATQTWYSVWVVSDGAAVYGLLSLSATAPSLPAGYYKARVGWVRTDSANRYPISFIQYNNKVRYRPNTANLTTFPIISSGVQGTVSTYGPSWVAVSLAGVVPPTACIAYVTANNGTSSSTQLVAPSTSYLGYGSTGYSTPVVATGNAGSSGNGMYSNGALILESLNLYVASDGAGCSACVTGWEDNL